MQSHILSLSNSDAVKVTVVSFGQYVVISGTCEYGHVHQKRRAMNPSRAGLFEPVPEAPLPWTFCMFPSSNTPDSDYQLVRRD